MGSYNMGVGTHYNGLGEIPIELRRYIYRLQGLVRKVYNNIYFEPENNNVPIIIYFGNIGS